jgi:hypothetical protein
MSSKSSPLVPLQFINYNGTIAMDLTVPTEITNIGQEDFPDVWAADDDTLYLFGEIYTTQNGSGPVPLVRLNFSPETPATSITTLELTVFPNPSTDVISVDIKENAHISIVTLDGQVKLETDVKSKQDLIDVSAIQKGSYIIKAVSKNKIGYQHFIKN